MENIGLDPAGPGFFKKSKGERIHARDAKKVEIIHTNAGEFGYPKNIGIADFWPNGGKRQPGCSDSSCSHSRAYEYYAESLIDPDSWLAIPCKSYEKWEKKRCNQKKRSWFPRLLPVKGRGNLFLQTNCKSPFGLGYNGSTPSGRRTC